MDDLARSRSGRWRSHARCRVCGSGRTVVEPRADLRWRARHDRGAGDRARDSPRASAGRDREARPRHDRPVELVRGHAGLRVGAFIVTVRIGWGDCQAGCIDEHTWVYAVSPDGSVTLQSEGGGTVPDRRGRGAGEQPGRTGILVTAVAGPTCPVETIPPDPACAPRPVPDTLIDITDGTGRQVARQSTDGTGTSFFELPPGVYAVTVADTGEGFFGIPEAQRSRWWPEPSHP